MEKRGIKTLFIMRNLISYFALVIVLFFASCTKEALVIPQNGQIEQIETRSQTITLQISEISSSDDGVEYTINFSSNYDFSDAVLESTQYLNFTDENENTSTLSFQLEQSTAATEGLTVVYLIGSNDLAGLELTGMQEIIIEDDIIN